ncbi:MAG: TRAP transporter small permease [Deltaproteobacteria bacterium]|nr:TRAP transporter small permease [Deltaproteobacteria bacterium]MBW1963004.1 TRAP transporter small permease [Deltaproteobacteria bacterium]MBW2151607.1 TRAP transporter small permease [Deltaproteobacteria bacterium]
MKSIALIKNIWNNFEDYVSAVAMVMMVSILFAQVFTRYLLQGSITWAEELSRFAFLWMMFLASSLAARQRSHIRVTAPILLLPKKMRLYVIVAADVIWVVFNIVVAYHSVLMVRNAFKFIYFSPSLNLNMAYMFLVIPISFVLMTVRIIVGYYRQFTGKEKGYNY